MAVTPALDAFTRAYLICALWTSDPNPTSGEFCERDEWSIDNISAESLARAIADCEAFQRDNAADLAEVNVLFHADAEQHGHDFWLTRNHHGAGFWDRGYGPLGETLTRAAHAFGEANVSGPETNAQGAATDETNAAWNGVIYID